MVESVLGTKFRVHATVENQNNLVGVPLTLLEAPEDCDALVVECGANVPGEIARLRDVLEPSVAVVTNISAGHLAGFGTIEQVLVEKAELARSAPLALVGTEPLALWRGREATRSACPDSGFRRLGRCPPRGVHGRRRGRGRRSDFAGTVPRFPWRDVTKLRTRCWRSRWPRSWSSICGE